MGTAIANTGTNNCTLYEIEDTLQALVNSIDPVVDTHDRQLILDEIGQELRRTNEKRDRVVAFLRHCQQQQKFGDAEIARIEKRKAILARVQEELELYIIQVIEQFAPMDRRGIKRLEGNVSSMRIQKNPDSVVITDIEAIPLMFKQIVLTMPAYVWEGMLQRIGFGDRKVFEARVEKAEFRPDKTAIGSELMKGVDVPGADLRFGDWRLVVS
jgi:hypothetical protein